MNATATRVHIARISTLQPIKKAARASCMLAWSRDMRQQVWLIASAVCLSVSKA